MSRLPWWNTRIFRYGGTTFQTVNIKVEDNGKVRLSRKALMPKPEGYVEPKRDSKPRERSGSRSGGRSGGRPPRGGRGRR